ncbi:LuxR family transcriptional regulator [Nocardia sp. CC227C]|uniref:helix-turn-helix transcriptional regulator n=1 Tax=Nocardia sp. CC227C TaxID=3044562 RepID=UPI00278BB672|nr:AAA family ATPase [Nocardia sp. CC227C]
MTARALDHPPTPAPARPPVPSLVGRTEEVRRISALTAAAAAGRGGGLALLGDPGAGKSALLEHAEATAPDPVLVLRCTGVESEAELPFAGLQLLVQPFLHRIDDLAEPHRGILRRAFGLSAAANPASDRFALGLATLELLAEIATEQPLLCLIDDAQWLDCPSVDALHFAAHRLDAEAVALIFAGRPEYHTALEVLRLGPLDAVHSRTLLDQRFPHLAPELRERVLTEAIGIPLAVLELPRMDLDTLPVEPLPIPDRLCVGYADHIAAQPDSTRLALLVVAAEETGCVRVVERALRQLGLGGDALVAAENSGMVMVSGTRVAFRHPLKRSAAYRLAPFTSRQAVHAALAQALADDPDRRAWHLAAATAEPDETIAAAVEATALRAADRSAHGVAATAFERAARLTPDPAHAARRLIRAMAALVEAGRPEHALVVADRLDPTVLDAPRRARLYELRAQIAFESDSLTAAYDLFLAAAKESAVEQPYRAGLLLLDAARTAWVAGDLPCLLRAREHLAELALGTPAAPLLAAVDGPIQLVTGAPSAGVALIRAATNTGRPVPNPAARFPLALLAALASDIEQSNTVLTELAAEYSALGMAGRLPAVHGALGTIQLLLGRFRDAEATCLETARLADCTGTPSRGRQARSILAVLAAVRGDAERCRELTDWQPRRAVNTVDAAHNEWALLHLDLAQGRYEAAVARGEALANSPHRALAQWPHLLADRVEAAVRWRRPERAAEPLAALVEFADATDNPWVRGLALRCGALVDGDPDRYEEALRLHTKAQRGFDHARTELLYGEWLRRERRVREARTRLSAALADFERLDARPWAERARAESRAAGGAASADTAPPTASDHRVGLLTPQELQVVRLAARGATNNEIGARLFLSPKTVGHHLYRAFPKLGVRSRVELARLLADESW